MNDSNIYTFYFNFHQVKLPLLLQYLERLL